MTPKEKAEELFNQYANVIYDRALTVMQYEICKQCALIAVDEIILSRKDDSQFDDTLWAGGSDMYRMHPMYLNYWQEIKQEIENL
jgi:hypothetical protein